MKKYLLRNGTTVPIVRNRSLIKMVKIMLNIQRIEQID